MSKKATGRPVSPDPRRFLRVPVRWYGDLLTSNEEYGCIVLDISPAGARIQAPTLMSRSTHVELAAHLGGRFKGQVEWQRGSLYGIKFVRIYSDFLSA